MTHFHSNSAHQPVAAPAKALAAKISARGSRLYRIIIITLKNRVPVYHRTALLFSFSKKYISQVHSCRAPLQMHSSGGCPLIPSHRLSQISTFCHKTSRRYEILITRFLLELNTDNNNKKKKKFGFLFSSFFATNPLPHCVIISSVFFFLFFFVFGFLFAYRVYREGWLKNLSDRHKIYTGKPR